MTEYSFADGHKIEDFRIHSALSEIESSYGDKCFIKPKTLRKFGRNTDIDSVDEEMVWTTGGIETIPSSNIIDSVVSTSASDTQSIKIEGHTIDGSSLTFKSQALTLNGTTPVALPTPLRNVTRLSNESSSNFVGNVTVEDTSNVPHLTVEAGGNQSLKCATSISDDDYWLITNGLFSVRKQAASSVDFKIQVRNMGSVWKTKFVCSVSQSSGSFETFFEPLLIVPSNSDVRVLAGASANNTQVDAILEGYLAKVKGD